MISIFQKNSRDKVRAVRLVTIVNMFKILEEFAKIKNPPVIPIYKSVIFSLMDNPSEETIRELYLTNFQTLFKRNQSIPV